MTCSIVRIATIENARKAVLRVCLNRFGVCDNGSIKVALRAQCIPFLVVELEPSASSRYGRLRNQWA